MTHRQEEALALVAQGLSRLQIAARMGMSERSLRKLIARARAAQNADPAVQEAMRFAGMEAVPHSGWIKRWNTDEGRGESLYFKTEADDVATLDAIVAAFDGLPAAMPVAPPVEAVARDLCTAILIFDAHLGQHSWGRETGEDYDLRIADRQLRDAVAKVVARAPASEKAVVLVGGDFLHIDDTRSETPANRHKLDADGRYSKVVDTAIEALVYCIEAAAARNNQVDVRVLRGNHDEHSHVAIRVGLAQRYRDDERVNVITDYSDFYCLEWGRCFVVAHHGDKGKPERLALMMADRWPETWGRTRYRYFWTGHVHHDRAKDVGGVQWESFRAVAARDAYAASHGFSGTRTLQAVTLDKHYGEVGRVKAHLGAVNE